MADAVLRFGTCSWADKTLLACGRFYPPDVARDAQRRLGFYASRFDLVEVDTTYYALPTAETVDGWIRATPPGFTFDVKAYALMTGHAAAARTLPPDLRAALPAELCDAPRLEPRALDAGFLAAVDARFGDLVAPLAAAGKLGVVLFQFPPWFGPTKDARRTLATLRARLPACEIAVELRNGSWMDGARRSETLALLAAERLDWVVVDAPQGFPSSVPPVVSVTGRTAIARFHGRNKATWAARNATAADRMNWSYADAELAEWVPRLERLAAEAEDVHVLMNNCHEDKAILSAVRMRELVGATAWTPKTVP